MSVSVQDEEPLVLVLVTYSCCPQVRDLSERETQGKLDEEALAAELVTLVM